MIPERPAPIMGLFDKTFWHFLQQGELRLQRCVQCAEYRYPPSAVCPYCHTEPTLWEPVSGLGKIVSWTVFHKSYFDSIPVPYTVLSVELEEGPMLIGNLIDQSAAGPDVGGPVQLHLQEVSFEGVRHVMPQWQLVRNLKTTDETSKKSGE